MRKESQSCGLITKATFNNKFIEQNKTAIQSGKIQKSFFRNFHGTFLLYYGKVLKLN